MCVVYDTTLLIPCPFSTLHFVVIKEGIIGFVLNNNILSLGFVFDEESETDRANVLLLIYLLDVSLIAVFISCNLKGGSLFCFWCIIE